MTVFLCILALLSSQTEISITGDTMWIFVASQVVKAITTLGLATLALLSYLS